MRASLVGACLGQVVRAVLILFSGTLVLGMPGAASADVAVLSAARDNTLYFDGPVDRSNGSGEYLFIGKTDNGNIRRATLAFDIAGSIPAGATINSVSLRLYTSRTKVGSSSSANLYRALADWGEGTANSNGNEGGGAAPVAGDATWFYRFYATAPWTTPGGDFSATSSGLTSVGANNQFYTWSSAGMVADVQFWLDNPASDFGWVLRGNEAANQSAKRFNSRSNATNPPRLTVDFTPSIGPPTGGCCLADGTCVERTELECAAEGGVYQGDEAPCLPNPCTPFVGACCFDDGACAVLTSPDCLSQDGTYQGDATTCVSGLCPVILEPFVDALTVPPIAVPTSGSPGGPATYDIAMVEFRKRLHRDLPLTTVWGYDGQYPGPTILASSGDPITVNWRNDLRDSTGVLRSEHYLPVDLCMHGPDTAGPAALTVVHLHGGHVPAAFDGHPDSTFAPGGSRTDVYPNNQDASFLWYHDHALGITRLNVLMGLAGGYLISDPLEASLGLPTGAYDVPLIIQDRSFHPDGSLKYPAQWHDHFFGEAALVNGTVWPYFEVDQGVYRLRLLNGSNSRAYTLRLSDGAPFTVIGGDGGLLESPVMRDSLTLTPAERVEVLVDFSGYTPGTEILLLNSAPSPFPNGDPMNPSLPQIMKFIVNAQSGYAYTTPPVLRPMEALQESEASEHRDFSLMKMSEPCAGEMWTINGMHWDHITEYPLLGDTEVWRFINPTGIVHPMHMHLVFFQVLDRTPFTMVGDSLEFGTPVPPDPVEAGWKDTVPVYPNEAVRVIARFEDYTGRFAYHCHILEHEDHEMMRQFEVRDTTLVVVDHPAGTPREPRLLPGYPNPTTGKTRIAFEIPNRSRAQVALFDAAGRRIVTIFDAEVDAGRHEVYWDSRTEGGERVPGGIYFYRLTVPGHAEQTRKLLVLK